MSMNMISYGVLLLDIRHIYTVPFLKFQHFVKQFIYLLYFINQQYIKISYS